MTTAADAIVTALKAVVPADVAVYDTLVPGVPPARYVVAYVPGGEFTRSTVAAASDDIYLYFQVTSVASDTNPTYSAVYCRWLSNLVRATLTDLRITADGWAPAVVSHTGCEFPQPDEATPDKKVYASDQFSLHTVRIS